MVSGQIWFYITSSEFDIQKNKLQLLKQEIAAIGEGPSKERF